MRPITTDWRKRLTAPWSRDLGAGDRISDDQNLTLCHTRLADFGLETVATKSGWLVREIRRAA
jgi:hypothetical protein